MMPIYTIETPSGRRLKIEADTPEIAMKGAEEWGAANEKKSGERGGMSGLTASNVGMSQGLTFGFGDELMAGALAPVEAVVGGLQGKGYSLSDAYNRNLERERAMISQAKESSPVATGIGELAGGLMTGGKVSGSGATLVGRAAGRGLGARAAAGAAEGAAYGGLYGLGTGEGGAAERMDSAAGGALAGGIVGGAIPLAGAAMRAPFDALSRRKAVAAAPSNEELRKTAKAAYQTAENAGLQFSQRGYGQLAQGISDDMAAGGYNPRLNPKIAAVLDEVKSLSGQAPTLERLEQVRRVALNAQKSMEPADKALAGRIIENIDQFVDRISPADIVAGSNRTQAVQALKQGRETWRRLRKSELLDDAFFKAENQASGFENGLRTQFRSLLGSKRTRGMFSKEEQAAMVRVVRGGAIENALKLLGKFGFGEGQATNMLGGSIGAGAGAAVGGPVGAMAVPMVGTAARRGAQAATRANAEFARALVRAGKVPLQRYPAIVEALNNGTIDPALIAGTVAATQ